MAKFKMHGWRYGAFIGGLVGLIGLTLYPIVYKPMFDTETKEYYKRVSAEARKNIRQEDVQPGNMKIWSDPFDRKKSSS